MHSFVVYRGRISRIKRVFGVMANITYKLIMLSGSCKEEEHDTNCKESFSKQSSKFSQGVMIDVLKLSTFFLLFIGWVDEFICIDVKLQCLRISAMSKII